MGASSVGGDFDTYTPPLVTNVAQVRPNRVPLSPPFITPYIIPLIFPVPTSPLYLTSYITPSVADVPTSPLYLTSYITPLDMFHLHGAGTPPSSLLLIALLPI